MGAIYITFGDSAYGNLKHAFQQKNEYKNAKIICVNEDFSIGPINKLGSIEGMQERKQWLKDVLTTIGPATDLDYLDWIETTLQQNSHIAEEIPSHSKVILWHGENASDAIGVRFVLSLLHDKNIQFEEVNVTEFSNHIEFKVQDSQGKEIPHVLKSLAEMPSEFTFEALQMKKELSQEQVQSFIQDWEKCFQSNGVLRILENGKIASVSEDYYDAAIFEHTSNEYQRASRIVGEVMGKSEQRIGDTYLNFRVHQLIQQGKLDSQGNLTKMEIRLP
ncbi:TPA: DUF1835 domain-containing protein [Bacillus cereus]|nr:DUF1835 domain-containing protein [Bacillus cereus]HDR4718106.1 DUF1835 domain-containing protein [Bacillus cereus]HDR4921983.1 DUF1835 domain-containing protein [Bacillus cereus]HDR5001611.1 DUF1835 domain-containing protein [Bacillus cereus]HEC4815088.1 DUF1835 domain-containing protein [Bacillus cereus]